MCSYRHLTTTHKQHVCEITKSLGVVFTRLHFLCNFRMGPCEEAMPFVKLSLIQIFELNNRLTVRNLNKATSQTSSLINHKCRQSVIAMDVFLSPTLLWMLIDDVVGFDQCTHTHTRSLPFCLSATLLSFPFFPFHIKTLSPIILIIN
jgi:hypothetical protein